LSLAPDCGATAKWWLATKLLYQNNVPMSNQSIYSLMSMVFIHNLVNFEATKNGKPRFGVLEAQAAHKNCSALQILD
jgi:hypothetical protein